MVERLPIYESPKMTLQQLLQHCKYSLKLSIHARYALSARLKGKCNDSQNVTYQQQSTWKAEPSETATEMFQMNMKTLVISSGTTCNS